MPALPLDEAGKYVAGAYVVFLALVLVYLAIMAAKLTRIERELGELNDLAGATRREAAERPPASQQPAGDGELAALAERTREEPR